MLENDRPGLVADLRFASDGLLRGFVADPQDPSTRFAVDIIVDGLPVALLRAQDYVADLDVADGCYGFTLQLSEGLRARARRVEARLANSSRLLAALSNKGAGFPVDAKTGRPGFVRWTGGLTVSGWLAAEESTSPPVVKALLHESEVARVECRSWTHVEAGGSYFIARAFELRLPRRFADGRVHTVAVMTEAGVELDGSPCLVFALEDGFAGVIDSFAEIESERVRARFADGLVPQSVPFSDLEGWRARFPTPRPENAVVGHVAVVIIGEADLEATLSSLRAQEATSWSAAVLPTTTSPVHFDVEQFRAYLAEEGSTCDLVVAAISGTRFVPEALSILADTARQFIESVAVYCDVALMVDGKEWPLGLPSYDKELFLEQGYCGLLFAVRPAAAEAALTLGCNSLYRLFPVSGGDDIGSPRVPVHVPAMLAARHRMSPELLRPALLEATSLRLAEQGTPAEVTPLLDACSPAVRVRRKIPSPEVSILIGVRDTGDDLDDTLESLRATSAGIRVQIIIADNESTDPRTSAALEAAERHGADVMRVSGWFNEPHLLNRAATLARHEHLLFLRPGVMAQESGWLEEMLSRSVERAVGAVGPLIAWPDGLVREAGIVLGPRLSVASRFRDRHVDDSGYAGWLEVAHEVSAVSVACMLTTRRCFSSLNGFDEHHFRTTYFDVDYCLRLREIGCGVIFTPHARLFHGGAETVSPSDTLLKPALVREAAKLREKWQLVPGCDPFYCPWMAMDGIPYSGLGWPPVPLRPRQPQFASSRHGPPGF